MFSSFLFDSITNFINDGIVKVLDLLPNAREIMPFNLEEAFQFFLDYVYVLDFILPVETLLNLAYLAIFFEVLILGVKITLWLAKLVRGS